MNDPTAATPLSGPMRRPIAATPMTTPVRGPIAATPMTTPVRDPVSEVIVEPDRPWKVVVWNDPINLMSYVAFVFRKLFGYTKEKADKLMLQVHHEGKAVVSSGTKEKAELDVFRLHEHGLWATMEQDT